MAGRRGMGHTCIMFENYCEMELSFVKHPRERKIGLRSGEFQDVRSNYSEANY